MAERTVPGADVALSIAGSDSSGGAGIQADLKTFAVIGVYGATAITAITAQNTKGVHASLTLPAQLVTDQIDAAASDLPVAATKTGMLHDSELIKAVAKTLESRNLVPLVVDPVMVSKAGASLIDDDAVKTLKSAILPLATVVTPNGQEAARLLGEDKPITTLGDAQRAARQICIIGKAKACIVTGIRVQGEDRDEAVDVFFDGEEIQEIVADWRDTKNTHGAGCTFSAAITGYLALGQGLTEAVTNAKSFISEAIRQTTRLGNGDGPVNHLAPLHVS